MKKLQLVTAAFIIVLVGAAGLYFMRQESPDTWNLDEDNIGVEVEITPEDTDEETIDPEDESIDPVEESQPPTYLYNREIKGDWVIDDYQEINDTFLNVDGSIFIEGDGKLVIRDSYLNVTMDYNREHTIIVGEWGSDESPVLELYNVAIDTEGVWMTVEFLGRSKIVYDNVRHINYNMPWHVADSSAEVAVIDSDIGLTIAENATLRAEDSDLFLEIMLSNCSGTYTLPTGEVEEQNYVFEKGRNTVVIETSGCTFREWGTTLDRYTNITFVDTVITIGMNAGLGTEAPEEKIVLLGLKAQRYDYFVVDYDTNHLELVNSEVISWYPQVWGGTVLEISDSELADLQWNGGDSVVIVRNCSAEIAYAMQEVTYHIYNSTIQGDITATEDSKIHLHNTDVWGKITELGNGQVFIDDEPYGN